MIKRLYERIPTIFLGATWFGLLAGIGEGVIFLLVQNFGHVRGVSADILWISPLTYLLLFNLAALFWLLVGAVLRDRDLTPAWLFSFIFLVVLAWLGILFFDLISQWAVLILALGLAFQLTRMAVKSAGAFTAFVRSSFTVVSLAFVVLLIGIPAGRSLHERILTSRLQPVNLDLPNIILIVMDTVRADHLSAYGYARETSPFLDQLAAAGVVFENAIASSSNSLPSHASIFSGLYPSGHATDWSNPMGYRDLPSAVLPEQLQEMGYRTGGFSANLYWVTRGYGFERGFIHFEDYHQTLADAVLSTFYGRVVERVILRPLGSDGDLKRRTAASSNAAAIDWVSQDETLPFFLFLNYIDAHDPYSPSAQFLTKFSSQVPEERSLDCEVGKCDRPLTATERQHEIDAYDGAIAYLDSQVEQLLAELDVQGKMENTIVIVISDHGEGFNEHGMYLHQHSLYWEVIRVPLLLWWDAKLPAGKRISVPVSLTAIPATLLDLISDETAAEKLEASLAGYWSGSPAGLPSERILSEVGPNAQFDPRRTDNGWIKSLVDGTLHYLEFESQPAELYDWDNDPLESENLAARGTQIAVLRELSEYIQVLLVNFSNSPDSR